MIGDPRAARALKDISAIQDGDEYEDQPFVILESVEVSHEARIDPRKTSPAALKPWLVTLLASLLITREAEV